MDAQTNKYCFLGNFLENTVVENDDQNCEQEKELSQEIPITVWNILPKNANYIRKIMIFSGYETLDSVITLQNEAERKKMFQFAVMMKDVIEDHDEMFGIFSRIPEKVMILPGLNSVFEKFIQAAVHLKKEHQQKIQPNTKKPYEQGSSSTPKRNKPIQPKHAIPPLL